MSLGRLIAVVGPSGVGKDSVLRGLAAALPGAHLVRRVITRAPDLGGEDYEAVSGAEFETRAQRGDFALHWRAHGLCYGLPRDTLDRVQSGTPCLANLSRKVLAEAAETFPKLTVLNITARPGTLAARLAARGRESEREIAQRLSEGQKALPLGLDVLDLSNDGPLEDTIARATVLLRSESVYS